MTVSNNQFDRLERLVEQLAEAQFQGKMQHDQEMIELRQLQASNARAIEANSAGISENRVAIAAIGQRVDQVTQQVNQVTQQVSELSGGVDAAFRTIESMNRVAESLETTQIEMRQQHHEQMDRLGNVLELLLTRYPMPPQAG
jgi:septal ring factor EnvC (AmiA/AmiB activator)